MNAQELEDCAAMWGAPKPHQVRYATVPTERITRKVIRCPGYNSNALSHYGWVYNEHLPTHRKPNFQKALEESIKREGVRNPVVVYAFPEGIFLSFGGSRLRAAHAVGLEVIPCIINDYTGEFSYAAEVTEANYAKFFTDVPDHFVITPYGADTHYSLERNRRHSFDPKGFEWLKNVEDTSFVDTEFSWISDYSPIEDK